MVDRQVVSVCRVGRGAFRKFSPQGNVIIPPLPQKKKIKLKIQSFHIVCDYTFFIKNIQYR